MLLPYASYHFFFSFFNKVSEWQNHETGNLSWAASYALFFALLSDPNIGESKVPVAWPKLTEGHKYVDINEGTGKNSIKQQLRARYVYFWSDTYMSFPNVNWKSP